MDIDIKELQYRIVELAENFDTYDFNDSFDGVGTALEIVEKMFAEGDIESNMNYPRLKKSVGVS